MEKSNRGDPKPLDVTQPSDIPPVSLTPIKPVPVDVPKPDPPHVDISVGEAFGLWFKWWIRNKAADAMAGLPADLVPAAMSKVLRIDTLVKIGLIVLIFLIGGGILAWMIFR